MSRAALAAAAAAIILFAIPASKPLYLDNMDFPAAAKAASETGLPIYYRGEENPYHSGLYHPPLYIYALAAWFRIWGFGETQARLFGLLCLFAHGWILTAGIRALLGRASMQGAGPWFWALFLLNPYTLQAAAVLDIDTSVYGPRLAGMIVWALRMGWEDGRPRAEPPSWREHAVLAVLAAAALWAKLTTALSVLLLVPVLAAVRWRSGQAVWRAAAAMAAGMALFLASYALYGWWTGQDITYTFRFVLMSLSQRSAGASLGQRLAMHGRTLLDMSVFHVRWTGLLPWTATGVLAAWLAWKGWRHGRTQSQAAALVLGWALAVTAFYCGLTYTFGSAPFKYAFPAWGIVMAAAALASARAQDRIRAGPRLAACSVLLAASFVVSGRWLQDRSILEGRAGPADLAMLLMPACGTVAGLALWRSAAWLVPASAAAHLGWALGLSLAMARAPYPTTYDYGQMGFAETVCFLQQNTAPDEAIISMKDVGFHAGRRYYENYGYVYGGSAQAEALRRVLDAGRARYAVFTEGRGPDALFVNPALRELIDGTCRLERSYGHYRIYNCRRDSPSAAEMEDPGRAF